MNEPERAGATFPSKFGLLLGVRLHTRSRSLSEAAEGGCIRTTVYVDRAPSCARDARTSRRAFSHSQGTGGLLLQQRGARDGRGCEKLAQLFARERKGREEKK